MDIDNLYKNRDILLFKECYALEKIHGTSAHISWKDNTLTLFSGGSKHENFVKLFNQEELKIKFQELEITSIIVYGEAYGGKVQGMKKTYGDKLKFVAFEVKIGESWLSVPQAEEIVKQLGLEFIYYKQIPTTIEAIDAEMNSDSVQAIRNGCGEGKMREGIVLRPLIEVRKNNRKRIIAKYKRDDFKETKTKRPLDEKKLRVLQEAKEIAEEWVTEMRLTHILDAFPNADVTQTGDVIKAIVMDIQKEAVGEIIDSKMARKAISKRAALMFKRRLQDKLKEE